MRVRCVRVCACMCIVCVRVCVAWGISSGGGTHESGCVFWHSASSECLRCHRPTAMTSPPKSLLKAVVLAAPNWLPMTLSSSTAPHRLMSGPAVMFTLVLKALMDALFARATAETEAKISAVTRILERERERNFLRWPASRFSQMIDSGAGAGSTCRTRPCVCGVCVCAGGGGQAR